MIRSIISILIIKRDNVLCLKQLDFGKNRNQVISNPLSTASEGEIEMERIVEKD